MKNIFVYYLSLITPLCLLMTFWGGMNPNMALALLGVYVLIYRTWLDGSRLYQKGLILQKDIWKVSYNGSRIKHFKALYLQK